MKTILMILLLSLPLLSNESEIQEPQHSLYQVKVLKSSNAVLEFEELEEVKFFMYRNELYEVWLKAPEAKKWRRFWRPKKCSCETQSVL